MTERVLVAGAIEVIFMALSYSFMSRAQVKAIYHWGGTILLCLTFCWSVILGCVLALNSLTYTL